MAMRINTLLSAFTLVCLIAGCGDLKSEKAPPASIAGKWNLVKDSLAVGTGVSSPETYTGVAGDYFDFRLDGNCYIKEGSRFDTLTYSITSDSTLNFPKFSIGTTANYIFPFPFTKATITTAYFPPGPVNFREVRLSR